MKEFQLGLRKGLPIALGYFPVAFSFGVLCVSSGLPLGLATLISLTNLTSSGQFAGVSLMLVNASYFEVSLTLLLINLRYFLMSLSLSQRVEQSMNTIQRMIVSFGITDETFALASLEDKELSFHFLLGFILTPIIGWSSGTLVGETLLHFLPSSLQQAMGIALYGMFLAIIIPASKKSKSVCIVVIIAILIHCILCYFTIFNVLSSGFKLIIATLIATLMGAYFFPIKEEDYV